MNGKKRKMVMIRMINKTLEYNELEEDSFNFPEYALDITIPEYALDITIPECVLHIAIPEYVLDITYSGICS